MVARDSDELERLAARGEQAREKRSLGEFLDDEQLRIFYRNVFEALKPGGTFYTSATRREGGSDYLLKAFEMNAHYRTRADMEAIFAALPWRQVEYDQDPTGLQTFIIATR